METIYVGFSRPATFFNPFSWIIRLIQWTPYSHVYLRINSKSLDRDIIYQASKTMVNFIGSKRFDAEEIIVKEFAIEISIESQIEILQFCVDNAGVKYGLIEALGIGWVIANSWFGRKVNNPFSDRGSSFVCSEFVGTILNKELGANLSEENIGPKQIYEYLDQRIN